MIIDLFAAFALLFSTGPSVDSDDGKSFENDRIDSVVVAASRAGKLTPVANVFVGKLELERSEPASSLPMMLGSLPSVVSTQEGGTGLGYTSIRIRGVGGYQTNVTLNGITLNDAESQEVFWVNIPGLSGILGSVQMQRGLGTVSAGPGSFGAGIDLATGVHDAASASADISAGSFGTFGGTVSASSGIRPSGFYAGAAFSLNHSDGYIRNAPADVHSIYGVAGWKNDNNSVRFTFLQGKQCTGITWEGVPFEIFDKDPRYNAAPGATDNYIQNHFQLNYSHLWHALSWSTTLNYSKGSGYYAYPGTKDALDNGLYVVRTDLNADIDKVNLRAGVYLSHYDGQHFGEADGVQWYRNSAVKNEADIWQRAEWSVTDRVLLYEELQYRGVLHNMFGPDEYSQMLDYQESWNFLSPRLGVNFQVADNQGLRAYASIGNREPSRSDIQADLSVRPERMADIEAAYSYDGKIFSAEANVYAMEYRDMLLETGILNSSGYAVKSNVKRGFRRGVELSASASATSWLRFDGNACFSSNRYKDGSDVSKEILLSPSFVGGLSVILDLEKAGRFRLTTKYVGKQYWDNSSSEEHLVPSYCTTDFDYSKDFYFKLGVHRQGRLGLGIFLNNIFNRHYYAYAYSGGVYPAAPFNGSLKITFAVY